MNRQKKMRDYAFRQLRRHAAWIERNLQLAIERDNGTRGLGTADFYRSHAATIAEQARKIACEYARFISLNSYI